MSNSRGAATSWTSRWRPPLIWSGVILVLTSWPSPRISTEISGTDKIAHLSVYAVLGFLVSRALLAPRTRTLLAYAILGMAIFGALDEVHQLWVPGRDASPWDWTADLLGATAGLLVGNHLLSLAQSRQDLST